MYKRDEMKKGYVIPLALILRQETSEQILLMVLSVFSENKILLLTKSFT